MGVFAGVFRQTHRYLEDAYLGKIGTNIRALPLHIQSVLGGLGLQLPSVGYYQRRVRFSVYVCAHVVSPDTNTVRYHM